MKSDLRNKIGGHMASLAKVKKKDEVLGIGRSVKVSVFFLDLSASISFTFTLALA